MHKFQLGEDVYWKPNRQKDIYVVVRHIISDSWSPVEYELVNRGSGHVLYNVPEEQLVLVADEETRKIKSGEKFESTVRERLKEWANSCGYDVVPKQAPTPPKKKINWKGWGIEALVQIRDDQDSYYLQKDGTTTLAPKISYSAYNPGYPDTTPVVGLAPYENQPWHPWFGGECPVPEGVQIEVCLRNGAKNDSVVTASDFKWSHNTYFVAYDCQIIAFRLVKIQDGWEA